MGQFDRLSVNRRLVVLAAWVVVLLISDLPNVLWVNLGGDAPDWLWWGKTGVLGAALVICLLWKAIRPLWQFTLVFLIFYLAIAARDAVWGSDFWQGLFGGEGASFTRSYLGFHTLDVAVALVVIAVLWLIKRHRQEFFLTKGQTDAPIEPVRWVGHIAPRAILFIHGDRDQYCSDIDDLYAAAQEPRGDRCLDPDLAGRKDHV